MNKTTVVILAMMLVLSSVASASFLDWFSNGFAISGAPTANLGNPVLQETAVTFDPIKENSFLKYNSEASLGKGVTISSTYNSAKKTTTIKLSKKVLLKDNQKVKLDSGYFTTKVSSGYLSLNRGESIVDKITPISNSVKDSMGVKGLLISIHTTHNLPWDKPVMLENGFTARSHKESSGYSVVYSKSITVANNAKLLFKSGNLYVKVAPEGLTFTKSPTAFKGKAVEIVDPSDRGIIDPNDRGIVVPSDLAAGAKEMSVAGFATVPTGVVLKKTLAGLFSTNTLLPYNKQTEITAGNFIYITNNPTTNTAKGIFTTTMIVTNGQVIQFEAATTSTATVATPTTGTGYVLLTMSATTAPITGLGEGVDLGCIQPPTAIKIPFGSSVKLGDGYTATATKTGAETASLKLSRTINFVNGGQIVLPDRILKVNVLLSGVTFTNIVGSSDASGY